MNQENEVSAYSDPEGEAPWAMQVVIRVEKVNPPTHFAALRASARAVAHAIDAFENGDDGTQAALARWRAGRIRKVVRRARASAWERAAEVAAVVLTVDDVQVAVHLPGPTDQVHPLVAKLQVGGLNLEREEAPTTAGVPVTVYLNPELDLSTGKAAAQVAHASQIMLESLGAAERGRWAADDFSTDVRTACPTLWTTLCETAPVRVVDAGFTEIPPGSKTTVAVHSL